MYLLAGLGNPGPEYSQTRHNIGFLVADMLAQDIACGSERTLFKALVRQGQLRGCKIIIAKPLTYMNLSGYAVAQLLNWYKIEPARLLVVYDDMDLPAGGLRFRKKGGAGGHRGMASIIEQLGTENFPRLKLGIGRPEHSGQQSADWVLGRFAPGEQETLGELLKTAVEAVKTALTQGIDTAMNRYNRSGPANLT